MADRHTVDTITSDALDALYESLEAAQASELNRQLQNADAAFASATVRAAKADHTLARVHAELNRLENLDTVKADDSHANRFATGARWTIRMIRENALEERPETGTGR
jgi:hypothetical protein